MRVLVCGGRDFKNDDFMKKVLDEYRYTATCIIHGAARGADKLAHNWAGWNKIQVEAYYANWNKHGKAAGPIRNQQMLDEGKPDLVIAFPGGNGTRDMVTRAKKAGIRVIEVE